MLNALHKLFESPTPQKMQRWYSYDYFIDYETEATLGHLN